MTIIKRADLGRPLTWDELDDNFDQVDSLVSTAANAVQTATTQAQAASGFADTASTASQEAQDAAATAGSAASAAVAGIYSDFASTDASKGASLVQYTQTQTVKSKLKESVSVADYPGADNSGTSLQDSVFASAESAVISTGKIYVPDGVWRLSTPMILSYTAQYYGPGVLKFDNAEWWRRGGSSGSVSINENYTLFYGYSSQSDVSVTFDGVAQTITWVDDYTVNAPGSLVTTNVKINITNGTLQLGSNPESVRSYNTLANGGKLITPLLPDPLTSPVGMMNSSFGSRALSNIKSGENNTAFGSRSLLSLTVANNNTGFGYQTLYRATGDGNTAVGSIAGEWLKSGVYNSVFGVSSGGKLTDGTYNTAAGYQSLGESSSGSFIVAIGYRSLGNSGSNNPSYTTSVGSFAGDLAYGVNNTWMGYRAGSGGAASDGIENVAVGYQSMRNQVGADYNVGVGVISLLALTSGQYNTAVGHSAVASATTAIGVTGVGYKALTLSTASSVTAVGYQSQMANTTGTANTSLGNNTLATNQTGIDNTAIGEAALFSSTGNSNTATGSRALNANTSGINNTATGVDAGRFGTTASNNTAHGYRAGRALTTGGENVSVGTDALQLETTGVQNTAVGRSALRVLQDGSTPVGINNSTGVGYAAVVSGSNQVQLGNSLTTTYVYGTVQNRSDLRDKVDVVDTALGIDFIMGLRPVDGRWNMRDDYYTTHEDEEGNVTSEFDQQGYDAGTQKRVRLHHWFIAQEVQQLCSDLDVDFGGLQHQAVNGGNDIFTLGYDEFIPPVVSAVQACWKRMDEIEARLAILEGK